MCTIQSNLKLHYILNTNNNIFSYVEVVFQYHNPLNIILSDHTITFSLFSIIIKHKRNIVFLV